MTRTIGVLGGTFDPVHQGHLALLRAAQKFFGFDFVYVIPNRQNPLKQPAFLTRSERLRRLRRAIRPLRFARLCLLEWRGRGPRYTVDTLRALRRRHPRAKLVFICGSDALEHFHKWKEAEEIPKLAVMAVARRGGFDRPVPPAGWTVFPMKPVAVSSTRIRSKYDKLFASKQ